MNQKGHRSLGDMTIAYLREQLCLLERNSPVVSSHSDEWPHEDITETIPRVSYFVPTNRHADHVAATSTFSLVAGCCYTTFQSSLF